MWLDVNGHVEVADRAPAGTGLSLGGQPDLVSVVDPRRHGDVDPLGAGVPALAPAIRARLGDDLAFTATLRAARHVDHLAKHRRPRDPDLSAPAALRAGRRARARLGARAAARCAAVEGVEDELLLRAADRLGEADREVVA